MIRVLIIAMVALGAAGGPVDAEAQDQAVKPKKGLSLQQIAERQQDPARAELDRAIRTLKNGRYADAAIALYGHMRKHRRHRDEARYNLAKALYRMGTYRSALYYFTRLLRAGPKNRFYRSSLEWCLFISRKMNDDDAVNEVVARFGGERFPTAYRNEFQFRLARFHFDRALAIERGEVAGAPVQTKVEVEERSMGGKSIKGDIFGDAADSVAPPAPTKRRTERAGAGYRSMTTCLRIPGRRLRPLRLPLRRRRASAPRRRDGR